MGLERAPYYLTDGFGTAFVLGRAKPHHPRLCTYGADVFAKRTIQRQPDCAAGWVAASTVPSAPTAEGEIGYGYQWWIPKGAVAGEFMARGIYGQYVYINRTKGVVIATNAADRKFREEGVADQNVAIFRSIANSI